MYGWMFERMDRWMEEGMDGRAGGSMYEWMYECMDRRMHVWIITTKIIFEYMQIFI